MERRERRVRLMEDGKERERGEADGKMKGEKTGLSRHISIFLPPSVSLVGWPTEVEVLIVTTSGRSQIAATPSGGAMHLLAR